MVIRKPIKPKKSPGIITKFKLKIGQRFGNSPEKRMMYKEQLKKIRQELKEAKETEKAA